MHHSRPCTVLNPPGLFTNLSYNRTTQKAQFYCRVTQTTPNTSHVVAKYCWSVTSLRLRGRVFTEPLPRSGLHNPDVPLLRVCIAGCLSSRYLAVR
jgi:hypothetical protein